MLCIFFKGIVHQKWKFCCDLLTIMSFQIHNTFVHLWKAKRHCKTNSYVSKLYPSLLKRHLDLYSYINTDQCTYMSSSNMAYKQGWASLFTTFNKLYVCVWSEVKWECEYVCLINVPFRENTSAWLHLKKSIKALLPERFRVVIDGIELQWFV